MHNSSVVLLKKYDQEQCSRCNFLFSNLKTAQHFRELSGYETSNSRT